MKKILLLVLISFTLFSCAKIPNEVLAPKLKIDNSGPKAKITLEVSVYNQHSKTAFMDYEADMILVDNDENEIFKEKIHIKYIFPYTSNHALINKEINADQLKKIAQIAQVPQEELDKKIILDDLFISQEKFKFSKIKAKRKNIIKVLKDKRND